MRKVKKIIQCLRYKTIVLGKIGVGNHFEKQSRVESVSTIGNYNYFSFRTMIGYAKIGNYCSFGPDVKIGQSQHSIEYITTYQKISKKNVNYSMLKQQTIIENDVWIGANAVIMQGIHIGNGAVIGANAVVTHDVPPYAIVAGIPAKIIKYRFEADIISKIVESEWWNNDFETASNKVNDLFKELINKKTSYEKSSKK